MSHANATNTVMRMPALAADVQNTGAASQAVLNERRISGSTTASTTPQARPSYQAARLTGAR